ncbi:MAG: hypothetical protein ACU84J_06670 [Gammaproteobacteria bacterium]
MTHVEYEQAARFIAEAGRVAVPAYAALPRGGIIGAVRIVECVERSESPWYMGHYGFVLADPHALPLLPLHGHPSLFDVADADSAPIASEIAALCWNNSP